MTEKLIGLTQLQTYKTYADAKYQNKLKTGNNISISGNTVSVTTPTFVAAKSSGKTPLNDTLVNSVGSVTLQPGLYFVTYTCYFADTSGGTVACGFSTNTTDLDGFGRAFIDRQKAISGSYTQTSVPALVEISASDYPNGRTFYLLAQTNTSGINVSPRCYYIKF